MSTSPPSAVWAQAPFDPARTRENVRSKVTFSFMALFALVIVAYLGAALLLPVESERWTRLREVMAVVLPAVTGTLGIALGFYFGSQTKQGSE